MKLPDRGMKLPLEGIRVVDLTQMGLGPYATSYLADFGAEVIKVEVPGSKGDPTRGFDRVFPGEDSSYFLGMNRNKRAITLNTKTPEGKEILKKMVREADVFAENFRPGTIARLGLDYDSLAAINPRLVYCSMSAWGQTGPLVNAPGMDL